MKRSRTSLQHLGRVPPESKAWKKHQSDIMVLTAASCLFFHIMSQKFYSICITFFSYLSIFSPLFFRKLYFINAFYTINSTPVFSYLLHLEALYDPGMTSCSSSRTRPQCSPAVTMVHRQRSHQGCHGFLDTSGAMPSHRSAWPWKPHPSQPWINARRHGWA